MASNIKFKRSAVQNRVPTTAQLALGELALNTYDGKLYTEINTGSAAVVEIGSKLSSLVVDGDNGAGGGDVTFHGTTAGVDLTWDFSDNSLKFADNTKAKFGTGGDLEIFHDGSNSYIKDVGTGDLNISGSIVRLQSSAGETLCRGVEDAAFELYHNIIKRLETTANGLNIHEDTDKVISFSGSIGEIGNVPGFQGSNTAGSSLTSVSYTHLTLPTKA